MLALTFDVSDLTGLSPLSEDVWITGHGIPGTGTATNLMALTPNGVFSQVATTITTASSNGTTATITTAAPHGLSNNDKVFIAGVSARYTISSATLASNVATFTTTAPHGLKANDPVTISGMTPAYYNGTYQLLSTGLTSTQFTVTNTTHPSTPATVCGTVDATNQPIPGYSGYVVATTMSTTTFTYTTASSLPQGAGGTIYTSSLIQSSKISSCITSGTYTPAIPNLATVTTPGPHGLSVGQTIQLSGVKANGTLIDAYNGVFRVDQVPSSTTFVFSYTAAAAPQDGTSGTLHAVGLPAVQVSKLLNKSITLDANITDYSAKFIVYVSAAGSGPTALPFTGNGVSPTDPQTPPYANTPPVTSVFDIVEFAYLPWGATSSGSTATITTTSPHGLTVNSSVTISGVTDASGTLITGYNGSFSVSEVISPNQFTFTTTVSNLPKGGSGSAGGVTISSGYSTFDVSAVDGLAIPMTLTASSLKSGSVVKSVGVRPGFTRAAIGDAYTSFMTKDPLGKKGNFDRLLYDSQQLLSPVTISAATWAINAATFTTSAPHGLQPHEWVTISGMTPAGYNGTYQVLPNTTTTPLTPTQFTVTNVTSSTPATVRGTVTPIVFQAPEKIDNQFFTIAAPKDWLANQTETASSTDPMVKFWDQTINKFFKTGNQISIYLNKEPSNPTYSGSSDGTKYTLTNTLNTYSISKPTATSLVSTSTANWTYVWSQPNAPAGDAGLLQDQIWQALCRGVALDGVTKSAAPTNFSTIAWTDPSKWYTQHKSTVFSSFDSIYCPYSKFLHQSDINGDVGTASTTIFLDGAAYGFGEDENPIVVPPTVLALVPSKLDGTIPDDTTVTLRIAPWGSSVPSAPTSVVATPGNTSLGVTWAAPASNGGSRITEYIVKYSSDNGTNWKRFFPSSGLPITATSCTITGLTNGTSYIIKVIAKNAVGISLPSASSAAATPAATVSGSQWVVNA